MGLGWPQVPFETGQYRCFLSRLVSLPQPRFWLLPHGHRVRWTKERATPFPFQVAREGLRQAQHRWLLPRLPRDRTHTVGDGGPSPTREPPFPCAVRLCPHQPWQGTAVIVARLAQRGQVRAGEPWGEPFCPAALVTCAALALMALAPLRRPAHPARAVV